MLLETLEPYKCDSGITVILLIGLLLFVLIFDFLWFIENLFSRGFVLIYTMSERFLQLYVCIYDNEQNSCDECAVIFLLSRGLAELCDSS